LYKLCRCSERNEIELFGNGQPRTSVPTINWVRSRFVGTTDALAMFLQPCRDSRGRLSLQSIGCKAVLLVQQVRLLCFCKPVGTGVLDCPKKYHPLLRVNASDPFTSLNTPPDRCRCNPCRSHSESLPLRQWRQPPCPDPSRSPTASVLRDVNTCRILR